MKRKFFSVGILSILFLFASATGFQNARSQQVIQKIEALVNDEVITAYDVGQRMGLVILATGMTINSQEELMQLRNQVLENLIDEKLQVQEAEQYEVPVPQEEIQQVYERVARSYNRTPETFPDLLKEFGSSKEAIVQQISAEYAWQTLVNGRYGSYAEANPEEIDQILEDMEANAGQREYRLSEIFLISQNPSQDDRVRQTAERIRAQTDAFQFAEMARQFSQSTTAAQGGDLGWVTEDQLAPEILEVVKDMEVLDVSDPIKTPGGYYLIALTDRRSILETEPLDEILDLKQIGYFFNAQTTEEAATAWYDQALPKTKSFESCDNLDSFVESLGPEVRPRDLGEIPLKQLNPALRKILRPIPANSASEPINTPEGFIVFVICDRFMPEATLPSPETIEQQIENQRIALMSRRYLRDLRRDAIIEYK